MPRHVFANNETAHVWASGDQEEGRSHNGNFYFSGRKLYSYGSHFIVGYRLDARTFLLNASRYSPSTGKHQSYAWRAVSGRYWSIPDLTKYGYELDSLFRDDMKAAQSNALRLITVLAETVSETDALYAIAEFASVPLVRTAKAIRIGLANKANREKVDAARNRKVAKGAAIQLADMSVDDWRKWSRDQKADMRQYGRGLYQFQRMSKDLFTAHKVAKREGLSDKRIKALWSRLSEVRAFLRKYEADKSRIELRAHVRNHIRGIREALNAFAYGTADRHKAGQLVTTSATLMRSPWSGPALREKMAVMNETGTALQNEIAKAEQEAARIANAERLANWLDGQKVGHMYLTAPSGGVYLRAVDVARDDSGAIIGGELQTSHGASVPLPHAVRAFKFLKLCRTRGETWHRNGHSIRVGHYAVDRIDSDGSFVAGCHTFKWPEIEALAIALGVFDATPDASAVTHTREAA